MFFTVGLYISLSILVIGLIYKVSGWFRRSLIAEDSEVGAGARLSSTLRAAGGAFLGASLVSMLKAFFLDVLLLRRSFREDLYRWTMHMLIFWGFILLVLMHAFESQISDTLLPDYMSTLNPYLFLRDFFGLMVVAGIVMALYRRLRMPKPRLRTRSMDVAAIVIVCVIILSGFLLKGSKIASQSEFMRMVQDYSHIHYYDEEVEALKSYWVENYGLISPDLEPPFSEEVLAEGRELNDLFCVTCHSQSQWAAISYGTSRLTHPVTARSDGESLVSFFWYLHVVAVFAGLAWIPFGKMFHLVTSPLSLLTSSARGRKSDPGVAAVRRNMELDACTQCGACSERCSVGAAVEFIPNDNILPSEKILALRAVSSGRSLSSREQKALAEGLVVCTNCRRCKDVCPVGIDLQDMWTAVRQDMLRNLVEPYSLSQLSLDSILRDQVRTRKDEPFWIAAGKLVKEHYGEAASRDIVLGKTAKTDQELVRSLENTFRYCFKCKTCTSACPVPDYFENPVDNLGLLPHQIIHATVLGRSDLAASSRMLWACLGCYQCQEQCPQGVRVTDVLYAQKQAALSGLKTGDNI